MQLALGVQSSEQAVGLPQGPEAPLTVHSQDQLPVQLRHLINSGQADIKNNVPFSVVFGKHGQNYLKLWLRISESMTGEETVDKSREAASQSWASCLKIRFNW